MLWLGYVVTKKDQKSQTRDGNIEKIFPSLFLGTVSSGQKGKLQFLLCLSIDAFCIYK